MDSRIALTLLVALTLAVAGCLGPPGGVVGGDNGPSAGPTSPEEKSAGRGNEERQPDDFGGAETAEDGATKLGTFCETEEACTFWDDELHQYVLYDMDAYVLDVLIVPSASPSAARDTETMVRPSRRGATGSVRSAHRGSPRTSR